MNSIIHRTIPEQIARHLCQEILSGQLKPGELLREQPIIALHMLMQYQRFNNLMDSYDEHARIIDG